MSSSVHGRHCDLCCHLQVIAGVLEERLVETLLHSNPRLQNVLSFVIRTSNTFLVCPMLVMLACWLQECHSAGTLTGCVRQGSLLWVDYIRFIGLQPAKK